MFYNLPTQVASSMLAAIPRLTDYSRRRVTFPRFPGLVSSGQFRVAAVALVRTVCAQPLRSGCRRGMKSTRFEIYRES